MAKSDDRLFKRIDVGGSSESSLIVRHKRYRIKVDGAWYEGCFTRQWFGWQFEGYQSGIQLNMIDEVYEIVAPGISKGRKSSSQVEPKHRPGKEH